MIMLPEVFIAVANKFKKHGYSLYMIGGTSRDFLLGLDMSDYDFVTDATPNEIKNIYPDGDYTFSKFGCVKIKVNDTHIDITTLRVESKYLDYRHPSKISFTKSIFLDSFRSDFTINAIYIDIDNNVYDFHQGIKDLRTSLIKFIGNPYIRIKEDPLRILRANRFANRLGFELEEKTKVAISTLSNLLDNLNPDKIAMERKKK